MNIRPNLQSAATGLEFDIVGEPVIRTLRLALAAAASIAFFADTGGPNALTPLATLVFIGFAVQNIASFSMGRLRRNVIDGRRSAWVDLAWFSAMVYVTGGGASLFFPFYIFTILITAFRFGFSETVRITGAAVLLFVLTAFSADSKAEMLIVALRTGFLLALGYLIAIWGETNLNQKRGLALLHKVCRLSNPRFGADRTIAMIMERSRVYFKANSCVLVMRPHKSRRWLVRTVRAGDAGADSSVGESIPSLMNFSDEDILLFRKPLHPSLAATGQFCAYRAQRRTWQRCDSRAGLAAAEMLDAHSFISVPFDFRVGKGRIYVTSAKWVYSASDALFLAQIVAQVVPIIENIHLLDRIASLAAMRERRNISRDLHDSALQPYIGLNHALDALRSKTPADNPLRADIVALSSMTAQVLDELREFTTGFARHTYRVDHIVNDVLRRHVQHAKRLYDVDVALDIAGEERIGNRLAAAVVQMAIEGISNICKHTEARRGALRISCDDAWLRIEIENDSGGSPGSFMPASIAGRSAALGGTTRVEHPSSGATVVCIDIPV